MTIICFDYGHGGLPGERYDPGAVGNGLRESNLTEKIGNLCVGKLSKYNVDIKIIPRSVNLNNRVNFANKLKPDLLLSIHVNAGGGTGFESYISNSPLQNSIKYQNIIHNNIVNYLATYGLKDRSMKRKDFIILKYSNTPSVLLENLFIDSINDIKFLKDDKFLDGLADSVVKGVVSSLNLKKKTDYSGSYYEADIEWVKNKGIMAGYSDVEFRPDENITNARLAAFFRRFYNVIKEEK